MVVGDGWSIVEPSIQVTIIIGLSAPEQGKSPAWHTSVDERDNLIGTNGGA